MKPWRFICLLLCVILCAGLSGCRLLDNDFSALMTPPDPTGELAPVKQALDSYAQKGFTLKYPESGEYLAPFVVKDIDSDGTNEAFALYSTTSDGVVHMHIAYIRNIDGEWKTVNHNSIMAASVQRVLFSDMDNDGIMEIIVGWNVFGNADRQVAVYSVAGGMMVQRLLEKYSGFVVCDLDGDLKNELFINYLNVADKTATARLFALKSDGVEEISNCPMDANITQYTEPVVSTVLAGGSAVYIDAQKGAGMLTEVICMESGKLVNKFYDPVTTETTATFRNSAVASRDFNGDQVIDIPIMQELPSSEQLSDSDKSYITNWSSFDGALLHSVAQTIMNYTDGYYIELPSTLLQNNITLTRKISSRLRIIYLWDSEDNMISHELFRVQLVSQTEWDSPEYSKEGFFELARRDGTVYVGSISSYEGVEAVTKHQLTEMFKLIS